MFGLLRELPRFRSSISAFVPAAVLALMLWGCNPQWNHTTLGATPGTIVDLHGNSGLSALPAACQTSIPAFPPLPADWWAGITPSVRSATAVTGYETWVATALPSNCPVERRTDVYRAFFTMNIAPMAGKAGLIARATAILTARAVPGITAATIAASNAAMPNSNLCDAMAGSAFQLRQLSLAFPMPTGFTTNFLSGGGFNFNSPPIPNAYPNGPVILNLPNKNPGPGSLGHPRFEVDISQLLVAALEAGVSQINFMLTGVNEPPTLQEAPAVPQTDCKALFSLHADVETA